MPEQGEAHEHFAARGLAFDLESKVRTCSVSFRCGLPAQQVTPTSMVVWRRRFTRAFAARNRSGLNPDPPRARRLTKPPLMADKMMVPVLIALQFLARCFGYLPSNAPSTRSAGSVDWQRRASVNTRTDHGSRNPRCRIVERRLISRQSEAVESPRFHRSQPMVVAARNEPRGPLARTRGLRYYIAEMIELPQPGWSRS